LAAAGYLPTAVVIASLRPGELFHIDIKKLGRFDFAINRA